MPTVVPARHIPLAAVRDAATAIYDAAIRTPLVHVDIRGTGLLEKRGDLSPDIDLYLKLEMLQPIGSFKIRGAYNAIRQLPPERLREGVWTVSAGNAAQGVAFAARHVGARCSVMVMDTAPETTATILPRPAWPLRAAATAQPAAPSAMTCARSATSFIARATSSSVTTIDPSSRCSSGHIVDSTDFPPAPSTNDAFHPSKYTGVPARSDAESGAAVSGSAA